MGVLSCAVTLTLISPSAQAGECGRWCDRGFWETATLADVQAELAKGADPNARTENGWTPLHQAARYNENPAIVQALLDAGADPNARNKDGWTPLHLAARSNENPAGVQALLAAGADLNARDEDGETPLHLAAAFNKNPAIVQALLDAEADPNARDKEGWTPLHGAAGLNENPAGRHSSPRGPTLTHGIRTAGPPCIGRQGTIRTQR